MKHIALDKFYSKPKLLMTMLVMLTLSMFAIHSKAAQTDATSAGDNIQVRFDHMTTGFPLTGAHAIADCGSCHIGGVFKGTPRNCASCHTKGQRVIAIDMSATHFATTEPCDVCHTNTVTFLGARYDHGKAVPGQCTSCHNGVVSTGRAPSHTSGAKATRSCDSCHRTFAWLPASWNHVGVAPGTCSTCHNNAGAPGRPANHLTSATQGRATFECDSCHNFFAWTPNNYSHADSNFGSGLCANCHSYTLGINNTPIFTSHMAITGACNTCHTSITTWLNAAGGMPSNHIPFNSGTPCTSCHISDYVTKVSTTTMHSLSSSYTCAYCHLGNAYSGSPNNLQVNSTSHHSTSSCTGSCHTQAASYSNWSSN